jgi:hypothetical protein
MVLNLSNPYGDPEIRSTSFVLSIEILSLVIHDEKPQSSLDNAHTSVHVLDDLGNYTLGC